MLGQFYLEDSKGKCVGGTTYSNNPKANAEFIIKSVNNHEKLVRTLKTSLFYMLNTGLGGLNGETLQIVRRKIEQALKDCEE